MTDYILTFIYIILFIGICLNIFWLIPELQEQIDLGITNKKRAIFVFIVFPFIWLILVVIYIFDSAKMRRK